MAGNSSAARGKLNRLFLVAHELDRGVGKQVAPEAGDLLADAASELGRGKWNRLFLVAHELDRGVGKQVAGFGGELAAVAEGGLVAAATERVLVRDIAQHPVGVSDDPRPARMRLFLDPETMLDEVFRG